MYQRCLDIMFAKMRQASWRGETWEFGDGVTRMAHPDFLIKSVDYQEATMLCSCRAGFANFPCPKCLVEKALLHKCTAMFKLRTKSDMLRVYDEVDAEHRKTYKEALLKECGLHATRVSFLQALLRFQARIDAMCSPSTWVSASRTHTLCIATTNVTSMISAAGDTICGSSSYKFLRKWAY
jgi:hypothetical protein